MMFRMNPYMSAGARPRTSAAESYNPYDYHY